MLHNIGELWSNYFLIILENSKRKINKFQQFPIQIIFIFHSIPSLDMFLLWLEIEPSDSAKWICDFVPPPSSWMQWDLLNAQWLIKCTVHQSHFKITFPLVQLQGMLQLSTAHPPSLREKAVLSKLAVRCPCWGETFVSTWAQPFTETHSHWESVEGSTSYQIKIS